MSHYMDDTLNKYNSTIITITTDPETNQPKMTFILRVLACKYKVLPDWWTILIPRRNKKDIEILKRIIAIYNKEFNANLQISIE